MTNIYEISTELESFLDSLPDTGVLTEEDEARFAELTDMKENKIKSTAYAYLNLEGEIEAITAQQKRLEALKKSKQSQQDRVKKLIGFGMSLDKSEKLDFGDVTIKFSKSTGAVIDDESLVPDEFKKTKVSVDVALAKEALKAGQEVPGMRLEERKNLQIK